MVKLTESSDTFLNKKNADEGVSIGSTLMFPKNIARGFTVR
jgi:hypothetical protein